jgi:hypothetical protein
MKRNITDGADKRKDRLLSLIAYVANYDRDERPCTLGACQTFMLLKYGNRKDTVEGYIRELIDSDILKTNARTGDIHLKRTFNETLALFATAGSD